MVSRPCGCARSISPMCVILDIGDAKAQWHRGRRARPEARAAAGGDHPQHARGRVVHHSRAGRGRTRLPAEECDRRRPAPSRSRGRRRETLLQFGGGRGAGRGLRAPAAHAWPDRLIRPAHRSRKEVLQLLAEGRSNKEVAALLDLGLSTIETHRANLMQKLNLHNTAEIVLYAVRKGIIA